MGTTIGSGIFRVPAVVAERLPDAWLFAAVWVFGGLLAMAGALAFAELSAMYPRSGGFYVYIREAFGPLAAFVFGWAELLVIRPASYGAISIVSAEYLWRLTPFDGALLLGVVPLSRAQVTASLLIVATAAVNYRGVHLGALVQNVSTVLKISALLAIVVMGLAMAPTASPVEAVEPIAPPQAATAAALVSAFGLALVSILWAYDGFADLVFVAGEVKEPQRTLPRALIIGTSGIIGLYLLTNWAYVRVIPLPQMPGSPLIAADVAVSLLGTFGVVFISAAVALSTFGSLNGSTMTGPRIFFAMAEDGLFFRGIAEVHPRFGTPARSIMLMAGLGTFYVYVRTFAQLADQFIVGIWPFYAAGVVALFVLRRRHPDIDRPYRTWGYPWVPAAFLVGAVFLLGNYLVSEPLIFALDMAVIASGIPVYWIWLGRHEVAGRR
jgi:amino acid transporter